MKRLFYVKTAGHAVNKATNMLVESAKEAAFEAAEEVNVELSGGMVKSIAQEMIAMEEILAKEKELRDAQERLMKIRKMKYGQK